MGSGQLSMYCIVLRRQIIGGNSSVSLKPFSGGMGAHSPFLFPKKPGVVIICAHTGPMLGE